MRIVLILFAADAVLCGQRPIISSGGVVNAASYVAGGQTGKALSPASLVSIFGSNLAAREQVASGFPLPTNLGGTFVTLNGVPVPILYVSPRQVNVQLSTVPVAVPPPTMDPARLLVITAAGTSEPVFLPGDIGGPFGIFTLDGSGCGRGAVMNVAKDGSVSLNSPGNSASQGDFISVYGTGLVGFFNPPPAGMPALSDPLSLAMNWGVTYANFDLAPSLPSTSLRTRVAWAGLAPGFVGVDQVNIQIPDAVREGCGVPLSIEINGRSQPIPISIRKGGGACTDPPTAAYGQIVWQRTAVMNSAEGGATEEFTAQFPASPGRQPPQPMEFQGYTITEYFGPSCPLPGYKNLDAGALTIQGPSFGPVETTKTGADGLLVYRATLPDGTMRPGSFTAAANGGTDVGPFQSSIPIGSGIHITSSFPPGTILQSYPPVPVTLNWTGGDPDKWVTLKLVTHLGFADVSNFTRALAQAGTATVATGGIATGPAEIIVEVTPDAAHVADVSAPGLSPGGQHLWKYTYRFPGLTLR